MLKVEEGLSVPLNPSNCSEALQAAVDYRGDVSFELKDGRLLSCYAFSLDAKNIFYMEESSSLRKSLLRDEIVKIVFSGKDEARGKSWEDWQKKKSELGKAASSSQ